MVCLRNSWRSLKHEDNAILLVVDRLVQKLWSLLKLCSTPWCLSQQENQHFCSDIPASAVGAQERHSKPYLSGLGPFGAFLKTERSGRTHKGPGGFVLSVSNQPFWCVVPFGVRKHSVLLLEVASVSVDEQNKLWIPKRYLPCKLG